VVGDFFPGFDIFRSTNVDTIIFFVVFRFSIWFAGVVDVTGSVLAAFSVNYNLVGHNKKILPATLVRFVITDALTGILNNKLSLFNVFYCKKS